MFINSAFLICVGVEAWTFEQHEQEAVFIPVGCPHQVRNLKVIGAIYHEVCVAILDEGRV